MDPAAYLARLAYTGTPVPDAQTLADLQLAHLTAVPFENLDIRWQRPIQLGLPELNAKIVTQRCGGFCLLSVLLGNRRGEIIRIGSIYREG